MGRVAVIGLGNVLMGDDGFGPQVARTLDATYEFEPGVSVEDLGTPGLNLTPYIANIDSLVVVDTIHADGDVGELRHYRKEELLRHPPGPRTSPHDPGLKEALLSMEMAERGPGEVLLIGMIVTGIGYRPGLSPPALCAVPPAMNAVLEELDRQGIRYSRRDPPLDPDLWWLQGTEPS
jgi:hydrogenase maturation protease